jgi:hypothetical protein
MANATQMWIATIGDLDLLNASCHARLPRGRRPHVLERFDNLEEVEIDR